MKETQRRSDSTLYQLNRAVVDRVARKAGATTAEEIAALFGISRATLFRLLGGQTTTSLDTALDMAATARVPVTDLFIKVDEVAA